MTFEQAYDKVREHSLISEDRLRVLWALCQTAARRHGDVLELGVYRGGSATLMALALPEKPVHAFDTFSGIPHSHPTYDRHRVGDFSLEGTVPQILRSHSNVQVHQGVWPDQLSLTGKFALAHFDADTYAACKSFIERLEKRMSPGGIMVFDDYLWEACPGVQKAIDDCGWSERVIQTAPWQAMVVL